MKSDPVSLDVLARVDAQHHLHPFTNHEEMHAAGTHVIVRGEGVYLWDVQGRKLLDGLAGLWCVNVGYSCREIVEAVNAQMKRLPYYCSFFNSTTEPAIALANRLSELAPRGLGHVMFTDSGSEANETALKFIRGYWKLRGQPKRTKIVTRNFAYHGVTLATTSMTGLPACTTPFDLPLPGFVQVPGPNAYAANREHEPGAYGQWCLEETERIVQREGPETIAAIFVEPVQGGGRSDRTASGIFARTAGLGAPAWHPVRGGRSDHRVWPVGELVCERALELGAGFHCRGQGPHERVPAARRHSRAR